MHLRLSRLGLHLLAGVLTILVVFPWLGRPARSRRVARWSRRLLVILNVQIRVRGGEPQVHPQGGLLVSNHVSWLDIYALQSIVPVRFISKAEVRDWPVIGWLAAKVGTIFLVREKKADALRVNQIMSAHLRSGDWLALFPEGTTSDGRDILPFYPSLFQPALEAEAPIWPVRLRYLDRRTGAHCEAAAYHGDMTLWQSLKQVLRHGGVQVELEFLPLIPHEAGRIRRELARLAESAIRESAIRESATQESAICGQSAAVPAGRDTLPESSAHLPA